MSAAENGEVVGENVDRAAVDAPVAGDEAIPRGGGLVHAEIVAAMHQQPVQLFEAALVEQQLQPLARRELSLFVLALTPLRPAAIQGGCVAARELLQLPVIHLVAGDRGYFFRCFCCPTRILKCEALASAKAL